MLCTVDMVKREFMYDPHLLRFIRYTMTADVSVATVQVDMCKGERLNLALNDRVIHQIS
jgi:hypothetical protein